MNDTICKCGNAFHREKYFNDDLYKMLTKYPKEVQIVVTRVCTCGRTVTLGKLNGTKQ